MTDPEPPINPPEVRECDSCGEINKTLLLRTTRPYGIPKRYWYCEDCYDVVVAAEKTAGRER